MESNDKYSENLLQLLKDSLRENPPVAPSELYYDSQTKNIIKELGKLSGHITLLDYGCGNLRLLQGIKTTSVSLPDITYYATDIETPDNSSVNPNHYKFIDSNTLRRDYCARFDVIILMNVIHEVSVHSIATIFEDVRRLLKQDGRLFLVDMSVLPEGEPLSLPFYSWEFKVFFKEFKDLSYNSKSGIPIVFFNVPRSGISCYPKSLYFLTEMIQAKRNCYSEVACHLHNPDKRKNYNLLIEKLSLTNNNLYDLGLLMLLSGHANYRLIEASKKDRPTDTQIVEAAIAILVFFQNTFYKVSKIVTLEDLFQKIGSTHEYEGILIAITQMSNGNGFFFPIIEDNKPLQPTTSMDAFDENFSYNDIREKGLSMIQQECHNISLAGEL